MSITADVTIKIKKIKMLIVDVDGVLTDGSLFIDNQGEEYKAFNSRDGLGMRLLQNSGILIAVITGRTSKVVTERMQSLGLKKDHVFQGQTDKVPAFLTLCEQNGINASETAYMGDDIVDIPTLKMAGLAAVTADADPLAQAHADWISSAKGGRGAVRELCELIMQTQGLWQQQIKRFIV